MIATWPRERPAPGDRAIIKAAPGDFRVDELPAFAPEGAGEHLFLRLEKTGVATPEIARWLAAAFGVAEHQVGYAGLKDKRAVTVQWFSVCTPAGAELLPGRAGVRLCQASRHTRKLRPGQLAGNRFRVRLRDVSGTAWRDALEAAGQQGVPNYFGPQRFGRDNLATARAWLATPRRRRGRGFRAGLHRSVLRSFLFNEVLAARVADGSWRQVLAGDVDEELPGWPGCRMPTGPLWGRGRSATGGAALAVEQSALEPHGELCGELEHLGLVQQRRLLVLRPAELAWQVCGGDVELAFTLPPGGYATTLLADAFALTTPGLPA